MSEGALEKATICKVGGSASDVVSCQFRPTQYTISRKICWTEGETIGKDMETPGFKGGQPFTLKFTLVFDTYEEPKGSRDVRHRTQKLWEMSQVDTTTADSRTVKGAPPLVCFQWGKLWSFEAVITSLSQSFTMFDPDGTPVRSTVDIELRQAKEAKLYAPQNPTSGGHNGYAVHLVTEGETIDQIAFREYGDPNAWRHLAAHNNLDDPGRLNPGLRLVLAPWKG